MHDLLFPHQSELEDEDLLGYAATLGLDVERSSRATSTPRRWPDGCARTSPAPRRAGRAARPTFFVAANRHVAPHDTETLARALEGARASG